MSKIKLIAIIGRSASGKDYLFKSTLQRNLKLNPVIHYTTRPRREGETEGQDYFFITEAEFKRKEDNYDFFSVTSFRGWHYGIDLNSFDINKINIGVFNPIEIKQLYKIYGNKFELVIIETTAEEEYRYKRSLDRLKCKPFDEEGLHELCRRNLADEEDFKSIQDIPRWTLKTTDFTSYTYNAGYMDAVIAFLGRFN